jgi:alanyl-tRNA synthetase
MVLQGKQSVYQTDAFNNITKVVQVDERFGMTGDEVEDIRRVRIVADHVKGSVFLRADEVRFSNKEQGYILRRIFRHACDQYLHPGFHLEKVVDAVIAEYGEAYPEIKSKRSAILKDFQKEYANYEKVRLMDIGKLIKQLPKEDVLQQTEPLAGPSATHITGRAAVQLFTTYGTPTDQLRQKGFVFDETEFEAELEKHRSLSRSGATAKFGGHGLNSTALSDDERIMITRLHTVTHLLQQALRDVLGPDIKQEGSDINPERLRFDFRYSDKLTPEQLLQVEAIVNAKISEDLSVTSKEMPVKEALESGALAFFKEKYPEKVTVYSIGNYSKEFCGGPHVTHTGEIGSFKIVAEKSTSVGVRRIKAEVGK